MTRASPNGFPKLVSHRVEAIIDQLEGLRPEVARLGHVMAAQLLAMTVLQLRLDHFQISDEELAAFRQALTDREPGAGAAHREPHPHHRAVKSRRRSRVTAAAPSVAFPAKDKRL
ncbi:MAG: hypothetical protein JOZ70_01815 [Pseudolabrys sp.]|nr:hypothetical protein [Pseudolabrys sp.]